MYSSQQTFISVFVFFLIITNSLSSRLARSPAELSSQEPSESSTEKDTDKCGIRKRVDNGVTEGEEDRYAQFGEFPWIVAILQTSLDSTDAVQTLGYICSGSLLSESVILTAAHCVNNLDPNTLRIRAGVYDMNSDTDPHLPHQERTVTQIRVHGNYSSKLLYNDLALLRVNEPFHYAHHIGNVCAPLEGSPYISLAPESYNPQTCLVAGWGKNTVAPSRTFPQKLKKVYADLMSHNQCENELRMTRLRSNFNLHSSFVCAKETLSTVCQGDGGAPLVCALTSAPPQSKYVQIGVTSWGIGCSNSLPGIYAALKTNIEWINTEFNNLNGRGAVPV